MVTDKDIGLGVATLPSLLLQGSRGSEREAVLLALCARSFRSGRTIVFFRTKQRAHRAKILFGLAGLPSAAELHGDMSQAARLESLDRFRKVGLMLQWGTIVKWAHPCLGALRHFDGGEAWVLCGSGHAQTLLIIHCY